MLMLMHGETSAYTNGAAACSWLSYRPAGMQVGGKAACLASSRPGRARGDPGRGEPAADNGFNSPECATAGTESRGDDSAAYQVGGVSRAKES